jgi:hypothetical protein
MKRAIAKKIAGKGGDTVAGRSIEDGGVDSGH